MLLNTQNTRGQEQKQALYPLSVMYLGYQGFTLGYWAESLCHTCYQKSYVISVHNA